MSNFSTLPNLPDGITNAKFIQLYVRLEELGTLFIPILGVSFDPEDKHGNILGDTLNRLGLQWIVSDKEHLFAKRFPAESSTNYRLAGAGRFNYMEGEFFAWGASADYEVLPDEKHFKDIQRHNPDFRFRIDENRR